MRPWGVDWSLVIDTNSTNYDANKTNFLGDLWVSSKGGYDTVQANGAKLANTRIDNTGGTAI